LLFEPESLYVGTLFAAALATLALSNAARASEWQTLHPTAFGFCGSTSLCPRGTNRALFIGCPFLVPEPDNAWKVEHCRASYARQANELEQQGDERDARQARLVVRELDGLRAQGQPITARTIWQQTGLAYNSYARNAEAYALYRQTSSHLTAQRRRRAKPTLPSGKRDP
jgi:hypothetical protein